MRQNLSDEPANRVSPIGNLLRKESDSASRCERLAKATRLVGARRVLMPRRNSWPGNSAPGGASHVKAVSPPTHNRRIAGAYTAPATGAPRSIRATLIVNSPLPARNSRVPSSGSTNMKRSATGAFAPAAIDSSAHTGGMGARRVRYSQMMASGRLSGDVTGLPSSFDATEQPRSYSSITAGPAASVAFARNKAISSRLARSSEKRFGSRRTELTLSSPSQSTARRSDALAQMRLDRNPGANRIDRIRIRLTRHPRLRLG